MQQNHINVLIFQSTFSLSSVSRRHNINLKCLCYSLGITDIILQVQDTREKLIEMGMAAYYTPGGIYFFLESSASWLSSTP